MVTKFIYMAIPPATNADSQLNIIHYMRNNVPLSLVVVLSMLNQYVFEDMACTMSDKVNIAWIYFVLVIFDVYWTIIHCKNDFEINYPHTGTRWTRYAAIRVSTSLVSMFSFSYFVHKGVPFNCFYPYDNTFANIMFYLSFLLVTAVSCAEHYYWKKLPILMFNMDIDEE